DGRPRSPWRTRRRAGQRSTPKLQAARAPPRPRRRSPPPPASPRAAAGTAGWRRTRAARDLRSRAAPRRTRGARRPRGLPRRCAPPDPRARAASRPYFLAGGFGNGVFLEGVLPAGAALPNRSLYRRTTSLVTSDAAGA